MEYYSSRINKSKMLMLTKLNLLQYKLIIKSCVLFHSSNVFNNERKISAVLDEWKCGMLEVWKKNGY